MSIRTFPIATLDNNENVCLHYPENTESRLCDTCFRGKDESLAGNFFLWESFEEMRSCAAFREQLESSVIEAIHEYMETDPEEGHFEESTEIECGFEVGWSSVTSPEGFEADELEPFNLNKHVTGLRVRGTCPKDAPRTSIVTVVYSLYHSFEKKNWSAVIRSIYPGTDVGILRPTGGVKDLTVREGVVFFDWKHPGSP